MKKLFTLIAVATAFINANAQYTSSSCGTSMLISTGTYAIDGDDNLSAQITLPFTFNFYGTLYTELYVSTNGFITFNGLEHGCCQGYSLPNTESQPYIGLAHTDLYSYSSAPGDNGSIYYSTVGTAPNRVFVMHFQGVGQCCSPTQKVTGEIQLFESTYEIKIVSSSIDLAGDNATMGVAKGDETESTVVAGRNSTSFNAGAECWSLVNSITLPLTLINFSGIDNGANGNNLSWTTAGEVNTKSFEIQRSADGSNFEKLNVVAASVNSLSTKEYSYNDIFTFSNDLVYYYRLKMIDQDGHYKYSPVIMLRKNSSDHIRVSPNPFTDKVVVNIESTDKDDLILSLVDMNGNIVVQQKNSLKKGVNAIEIKMTGNIQKGIYLLQVQTSKKIETIKIIKQ